MEVVVQVRNVYGSEKIYPICDNAKKLADLLGTKTLTHEAITKAKKLGFNFTVKQETRKL